MHKSQHFIATALKRYMEMRHESTASSTIFYKFIRQQIRFKTADAITVYSFHSIQRLNQVNKFFTCRLTEITYIDSSYDNLLSTFISRFLDLLYKRFYRSVPAVTASKRNSTICAVVVASILYL